MYKRQIQDTFTLSAGQEVAIDYQCDYWCPYENTVSLTAPNGTVYSWGVGSFASHSSGNFGTYSGAGTWTLGATDSDGDGGILLTVAESGELGFSLYYFSTGGVGLTDGDYTGVRNYTYSVGAYTDGNQGYAMSDPDGIVQLAFDSVSNADRVSLDLFIESTGWETSCLLYTSPSPRD